VECSTQKLIASRSMLTGSIRERLETHMTSRTRDASVQTPLQLSETRMATYVVSSSEVNAVI
jgi:hypothetical protein